ncbi:hypothetical protein GWK36_06990 [Caldichromatium japonicum]|uniref:Uncharacterized protein n=1 Tax=Caldichromatium japonicum TaxID=2699430 RepID=A0A6G7VGM6_9GAMM|nr:flagellar biosynthetic protein FliR [Caldichromatium japonicum]QIK39144.1 hypothetical protein GWK36_06990 [Caldichromatium japonicum]
MRPTIPSARLSLHTSSHAAALRAPQTTAISCLVFPCPRHQDSSLNFKSMCFLINKALALLGKEVFIGLMLGFSAAIPFWIADGVGYFIDNQRGTTMASSIDSMTGVQTSPLFVGGGAVVFLSALYESYRLGHSHYSLFICTSNPQPFPGCLLYSIISWR